MPCKLRALNRTQIVPSLALGNPQAAAVRKMAVPWQGPAEML